MSSPLPPPIRQGLGNTFKRPIVNFTVPSTATPGQPRIVIASTLPPPLNTFTWNAGHNRYVAGIIFYGQGDDTTYTYLCDAVDNTAAAGNGIVHMGQVASGFVQVDANGNPRVQAWEYDVGGGSFLHRFDSDTFRAERVTGAGVSNFIEVNFGQILAEVTNASITLQALGAAGALSLFAGNDITMTATDAVQITSNTGKVTVQAVGAGGDMDLTALDLLRVISSNVLQLLATNSAFLATSAANGNVFIQANGATSDVEISATRDIKLTRAEDFNGLPFLKGQVGNSLGGPTATSSYTFAVVFPIAFAGGVTPSVAVGLDNAAGVTAKWANRAFNVTNTGFTVFGFTTVDTNPVATFSSGHQWTAAAEAV